jgi:hypothetical protein
VSTHTAVAPPIVELRRYVLHPGRRDELIDLFDREFVESQEAVGMAILGQFRDVDRPDQFVWLRGFDDMTVRLAALTAFYGGPVWEAHGAAASATMVAVDDVLLLRPAAAGAGLRTRPVRRDEPSTSAVVTAIADRTGAGDPAGRLRDDVVPALSALGVETRAWYETDRSENTFPRLPVRTADVLVWIGAMADGDRLDDVAAATATADDGVTVLRLVPTARSLLDGT